MTRRSSTRSTKKFLQLADKKKEVTDEDVLMLAGADSADKHGVQLDWLQVTTGKGVKSVASIGLNIAGQKFEAASSGQWSGGCCHPCPQEGHHQGDEPQGVHYPGYRQGL